MRPAQTRLGSAIEQTLNIGSGFILSMGLWQFIVAPLYGYTVTLYTNLGITTIFTVASFTRGYLWRRFFERRLTNGKSVHNREHTSPSVPSGG